MIIKTVLPWLALVLALTEEYWWPTVYAAVPGPLWIALAVALVAFWIWRWFIFFVDRAQSAAAKHER